MNVEHLTNEELANWMVPFTAIDDRSSGYIKSVIDEAARRLRNSIPKPVVEVNGMNGNYDVRINGVIFAWYSLDSWGSDLDARAAAIAKRDQFNKALGLEGGGDE